MIIDFPHGSSSNPGTPRTGVVATCEVCARADIGIYSCLLSVCGRLLYSDEHTGTTEQKRPGPKATAKGGGAEKKGRGTFKSHLFCYYK